MSIGYSSRFGATVKLVVLHTGEGSRTKESMAAFFDSVGDRSSHAICDANGLIDIVSRNNSAWTLGDGNSISVNLEMCAFAMMNREQWLSSETISFYHPEKNRVVYVDNPRQQIRYAAFWARRECDALEIPKRILGVGDTGAGILDHWTANRTYGWGDHTDVGPGFPWDVFLSDVLGTTPTPKAKDDEAMFIVVNSGPVKGTVAIVNGGLLSGVDPETASAIHDTNNKAGGTLLTGVSGAVFNDLVSKSQQQERIEGAVNTNTAVLRDVLAELKKLPHGVA